MTSEIEMNLIKTHHAELLKFTYFLLAGAGGAIGFALTQTHQQSLSYSHILLGLALAAWALSFWCGCMFLRHVDVLRSANIEQLKIQRRAAQQNVKGVEQELEKIATLMSERKKQGVMTSRGQYVSLFIGAGFFATWRFLDMYFFVPALAG